MEEVLRSFRNRLAYFIDNYLHISEQTFVVILAVFIGLGAGFASVGVIYLIKFFNWLLFDCGKHILGFLADYYIIVIPAIGGLLVGPMVTFWAQEAKGHGVPEVMAAVALKGGRIRPRVALVKAIASSICIGSGGSVGREGPIIQIGSSLGSTVGQLFRMSDERIKTFVAAGAAGGISATFNAPIAGVMFAMEIILGEFAAGTFGLIVISSVTAAVISRAFLGNNPAYFLLTTYSLVNYWELFVYVILGFTAGLFSVLYIKTLTRFEDFFEKLKSVPEQFRPVIGGLFLGGLALLCPQVLGIGSETVSQALRGQFPLLLLILLIFAKLLATCLTLGSGGSGGIFAPGLFMGAMLGGAFGTVVNLIFPGMVAPSGAYALVGMAAVFSGSTRASITAVIMLFEMTNDYRIILPLMITCVISALVSSSLQTESIYTIKLARRGINLVGGRHHDLMESILVKDAMFPEVETVHFDQTVDQVAEFLVKSRHHGFPVVDDAGDLFGMVTFSDVRNAVQKGKGTQAVKSIATRRVVTVLPSDNLYSVLKKLAKRDVGRLPVVDPHNTKKIIGIITRSDIIGAYDRAVTFRGIESQDKSSESD